MAAATFGITQLDFSFVLKLLHATTWSLLHENATKLDKTNIMTLVAMNDDKHNDVWVSCCHGNSTSSGMVSQRVLFL